MLKHILFVVILVGGGYYFWNTRPVVHGPGVIAPNEPTQKRAYGVDPIARKDVSFRPIARFDIEARVLSKKRYFGDQEADFAPYDVIVGWGPMSDERNLNEILIKQTDRSYYWEMIEPPIPIHEMREHTTNLRLIAKDETMLESFGDIRQGQIIRLKGYLVNVESTEGWQMHTSLIRKDSGRESAEIVFVNELTVL